MTFSTGHVTNSDKVTSPFSSWRATTGQQQQINHEVITDKKAYLDHKNLCLQHICIIRIKDEIWHCISRESNLRCWLYIRNLCTMNCLKSAYHINNSILLDCTQVWFQHPTGQTDLYSRLSEITELFPREASILVLELLLHLVYHIPLHTHHTIQNPWKHHKK